MDLDKLTAMAREYRRQANDPDLPDGVRLAAARAAISCNTLSGALDDLHRAHVKARRTQIQLVRP